MALVDMTTGQDLLYYVLGHGGQSQSTSDDYADLVKSAIQQNYWEILLMEPWLFALSPTKGTISTIASQSVVIQTIVDDTVTLSAVIATSMAGRKIYLDSVQTVYRITAHTAGTDTLTLDADWVETVSSGNATIFNDEYDLASDCMTVWGAMWLRGNSEREIEFLDDKQFRTKYDNGDLLLSGPPAYGTMLPFSASGVQRVQIAPSDSERMVIEYDYTKFDQLDFSGGAGDTPVIPLQNRWVLGERALWSLWRTKNNDLAAAAWNRAEDHLTIMRQKYLPKASRPRPWVRFRNNLGAS